MSNLELTYYSTPTLQLIVIPPYMTVRAHFKTRWRSSYKTENHNVLKQLPWDLIHFTTSIIKYTLSPIRRIHFKSMYCMRSTVCPAIIYDLIHQKLKSNSTVIVTNLRL